MFAFSIWYICLIYIIYIYHTNISSYNYLLPSKFAFLNLLLRYFKGKYLWLYLWKGLMVHFYCALIVNTFAGRISGIFSFWTWKTSNHNVPKHLGLRGTELWNLYPMSWWWGHEVKKWGWPHFSQISLQRLLPLTAG